MKSMLSSFGKIAGAGIGVGVAADYAQQANGGGDPFIDAIMGAIAAVIVLIREVRKRRA